MPLRDHFHAPLDNRHSWEGFFGGWPAMIVCDLFARLPAHYVAAPRVYLGTDLESNLANEGDGPLPHIVTDSADGGPATVAWEPPTPTLDVATDLRGQNEYEVRVYDTRRHQGLVAAVEMVSPANKERPEHRRAFLARCAALLQQR